MSSDKVHNLWGHDFRVVSQGLSEKDVTVFVEKLMSQHRERLKHLDHVDALRELASETIGEAEQLAAGIKEKAKKESEAESLRIVAEAKKRAKELLAEADHVHRDKVKAAARMEDAVAEAERRRKAYQQRNAEIKSSLRALKAAAVRELSDRMPSHYIGKHLHQGIHFVPAFESFIRQIEVELARDEGEDGPAPQR